MVFLGLFKKYSQINQGFLWIIKILTNKSKQTWRSSQIRKMDTSFLQLTTSSIANIFVVSSGLGSLLVSLYGIFKNNKILKMCGLCTYSVMVIMSEIASMIQLLPQKKTPFGLTVAPPRIVNVLCIALFLVQLVLSWPIKGVEFNPATNVAAYKARTKSIVGVLLINLAACYLVWAREDIPNICIAFRLVFSALLISRLYKYHKEREEELAKNLSPSEIEIMSTKIGSALGAMFGNGSTTTPTTKEKKNKGI